VRTEPPAGPSGLIIFRLAAITLSDVTVRLNQRAFDRARNLIATGRYVLDGRDAWSDHQPSARQENAFIEEHGMAEYTSNSRWRICTECSMRCER
jgi:hypothetical protein